MFLISLYLCPYIYTPMHKFSFLLFFILAVTPLSGLFAQKSGSKATAAANDEMISIYMQKIPILSFTKTAYQHFKDSLHANTKDALHKINDHKIEWIPAVKEIVATVPDMQTTVAEVKKSDDSLATLNESQVNPVAKEHPVTHTPITEYKTMSEVAPENFRIYENNIYRRTLGTQKFRKFRDSIATKTKDTLYIKIDNRVDIHPYHHTPKKVGKIAPPVSTATSAPNSPIAVFTNTNGYVTINLPLVKSHSYRLVFFDADGTQLFDIKSLKESELVLDKTNFVHAGWFSYELYEDEKLKEKNKFQLQKD